MQDYRKNKDNSSRQEGREFHTMASFKSPLQWSLGMFLIMSESPEAKVKFP